MKAQKATPEEAHLLQVRRPMPHRRIEKRMSTSSGNGLGLPAGGSVEIAGPKSYIKAQKGPKCKEMHVHNTKMQGNEGLLKSFYGGLGKRAIFGNV